MFAIMKNSIFSWSPLSLSSELGSMYEMAIGTGGVLWYLVYLCIKFK